MNHDTLYEYILSLLDQGKDHAEILSRVAASDQDEARVILSLVANMSNKNVDITPSEQALRRVLDQSVTAPTPRRFFMSEDGASHQSFQSLFQLFITSFRMQKPIALGVGVAAVILAVGILSVAVFKNTGSLGNVDQSLVAEDSALTSDFAELDGFLVSDASFENDLLAFADMEQSNNGSAELDTIDQELQNDNGAFSEDFETFEEFSDETSDEDLNTIAS